MDQCLFCPNQADSKEHLFPDWALKKINSREPIRRKIAKSVLKFTDNLNVEFRAVCKFCNENWMSALESSNIPLIGPMIVDISRTLDVVEQTIIATWVTKTAMVLDSIRKPKRFYERPECENLRITSAIPKETKIWIGGYIGNGLHAGDSNYRIQIKGLDVGMGISTTFLLGHFVAQISTVRILPEYNNRTVEVFPHSAWNKSIFRIWPTKTNSFMWPPQIPFSTNSLAYFHYRWALGSSRMSL